MRFKLPKRNTDALYQSGVRPTYDTRKLGATLCAREALEFGTSEYRDLRSIPRALVAFLRRPATSRARFCVDCRAGVRLHLRPKTRRPEYFARFARR